MRNHPIFILLPTYIFGILAWHTFELNFATEIGIALTIVFFCFQFLEKKQFSSIKSSALFIGISSVLLFASGYQRAADAFGFSEHNVNSKILNDDCVTAKVVSSDKAGSNYNRVVLKALYSEKYEISELTGKFMAMLEIESKILEIDDVIQFKTQLSDLNSASNPGEFDPKAFWRSKNIKKQTFVPLTYWAKIGRTSHGLDYYFNAWRNWCCAEFAKHLTGQNLAVAQALVFGDRSNVESQTLQQFSDTGAMHVLAVSGLHIGIVLIFLEFLFVHFFKVKSKKRGVIYSLLIIWFYCMLTGFSASVARSAVMFSILSLGKLFDKEQNNLNSLGVSAFLLLLWEPAYLFDIGFQLSYLAMIGIFWFYTAIHSLWAPNLRILRYLWEGTAVGFAAQILTVPLSLYYFHQFPNYFALTNIGLMVYSFLILAIGLGLLAFSKIPIINLLLAKLLLVIMISMFLILTTIQSLPGAVAYGFDVSWVWVVAVYSFIFFFWIIYEQKRKSKLILIPIAFLSLLIVLMTIKRYSNSSKDRILIMSNANNMFSIQSGEEHFCFYDAYKMKNLKKAEFVMKNCTKIYPGKVSFLKLPYFKEDSKITIGSNSFIISRKKLGYLISKNGSNFVHIALKDDIEEKQIHAPFIFKTKWVENTKATYLSQVRVIAF